jgi:hypothetical protein
MQVDATGPDDALVHCKQQVLKYIARKAIKKRKGVEMDTQEKEYPERKRRKLPPSKTVEFLRATMRESEPLKKIGNRLILTKQTLLEEFDGKPATQPLSFSAVPKDGKDLDDEMKMSVAKHFRFFHSILIPSSKGGSTELLSINDLLTHFMTTDGRAALLAILALSTGHTSMNSYVTKTLAAHRLPRQIELECHYGENHLSREPKRDWIKDVFEEMDHDEIVRDIFLASNEDCDELNELLLIFIKAVLMSYKTRSEQDYQAMDEAKDYTIVKGIPKLERVFDETDLDKLDVTTDEQVDVTHDDDINSADFESVFDKNNIKPSILVELNFSK